VRKNWERNRRERVINHGQFISKWRGLVAQKSLI
jgi:hypothetical protein